MKYIIRCFWKENAHSMVRTDVTYVGGYRTTIYGNVNNPKIFFDINRAYEEIDDYISGSILRYEVEEYYK